VSKAILSIYQRAIALFSGAWDRLGPILNQILESGTPDLRDYFVFGGIASVGYGTYQIYPPAAWIIVGCVFFWIGIKR
jgi:hypothetical protein